MIPRDFLFYLGIRLEFISQASNDEKLATSFVHIREHTQRWNRRCYGKCFGNKMVSNFIYIMTSMSIAQSVLKSLISSTIHTSQSLFQPRQSNRCYHAASFQENDGVSIAVRHFLLKLESDIRMQTRFLKVSSRTYKSKENKTLDNTTIKLNKNSSMSKRPKEDGSYPTSTCHTASRSHRPMVLHMLHKLLVSSLESRSSRSHSGQG